MAEDSGEHVGSDSIDEAQKKINDSISETKKLIQDKASAQKAADELEQKKKELGDNGPLTEKGRSQAQKDDLAAFLSGGSA